MDINFYILYWESLIIRENKLLINLNFGDYKF